MHVCVFSLCICPVKAQACLCLITTDRRRPGGGLRSRLHLAGLIECCLFFAPFFQTSCLSSVSLRADTRNGGKPCHCDDGISAWNETGCFFIYSSLKTGLILLQIRMDQTRKRWKRRLAARSPRPTFCLGILCQSANRWLSSCRWLPTVQVCVTALSPKPHPQDGSPYVYCRISCASEHLTNIISNISRMFEKGAVFHI